MTDYKKIALDSGFDVCEALDPATLEFMPEVREMCAEGRCQKYGKSWACPPAAGSLEYWKGRASAYKKGLILQTVGEREDSYDIEAMMEVSRQNSRNSDAFTSALLALGSDFLFMSAGSCTRCKNCTYPDAPCRFPEKLYPSMEACGLFVSKVCSDNGVSYYYGDTRIAYTNCLLYN